MASTDVKSSTSSKPVPTVTPSVSTKTAVKPSATVKPVVPAKPATVAKPVPAAKPAPAVAKPIPAVAKPVPAAAKPAPAVKPAPVAKSGASAPHGTSHHVSGKLIGLIIGCVVAAAVIGVGIWLAIKNSKKKSKEKFSRTLNKVLPQEKLHLGLVGNFSDLSSTPRFTKEPFEPTMKESYTKKDKKITNTRKRKIVPSPTELQKVEKAIAKMLDIDSIMVKVSHVQDVDETDDMYISVVVFEDEKNRYKRPAVLDLINNPKKLHKHLKGIKKVGIGHGTNNHPCPHDSGLTNSGIHIDKNGKKTKIGKEVRLCKGPTVGGKCITPGEDLPHLEYQESVDARLCV